MSNPFRRTALVTMAVVMIVTGVGCAQHQAPASNSSIDTGAYDQSGEKRKSLDY